MLGMLQISDQSTDEIASRNFCLFPSLYARVTKHNTVTSIENKRLIWTIWNWSEISDTEIPFNEQFKSSWLFVNVSSISVKDVLLILVGWEISGRNSLQYPQDIYKAFMNSLVKSSCFSELNKSTLLSPIKYTNLLSIRNCSNALRYTHL